MSLQRAIQDVKRFSQGDFSVEISFTTPDESKTVTVDGLVTRHNLSVNPETGGYVNARNVHCAVAESVLKDAGYTTRNAGGEIDLTDHKVKWTDATETEKEYIVAETMPSDTVGLIIFILNDFDG